MSKSIILLFVTTLLICSCQSEEKPTATSQRPLDGPNYSETTKEVQALQSIESKITFLNNLMAADQDLRNQEPDIARKFGYNSKEHKLHWENIKKTDEINLAKVRAYFLNFGFPDPKEVGDKVCNAPVYVIHHAPSDSPSRDEFLPILYKAYTEKKLDGQLFDFFLGRMYDGKFGKRMKMESPFKESDRIDAYLQAFKFEQ